MLCLVLGACGGGGGGGGGDGGDGDLLAFVDIREPIVGDGSYTTIQPSLAISGTAFTSPKGVDCKTVFPSRLSMTWRNISTGQSGSQGVASFCQNTFLGLQWGSAWGIAYGAIDLQIGRNEIKITISDSIGNSGTATVVVTRNEDRLPPEIASRTPAIGASDFPIYRTLAVQFSEAMASASLSAERFTLTEVATGADVNGFHSYDSNTFRWSFDPQFELSYATEYQATISGLVEDAYGGNPLGEEVSWRFTTAANPDVTPPEVSEVSPAPGSDCAAVGSTIFARFNEAMDPESIDTNRFTLRDSDGLTVAAEVSYDGTTAKLAPQLELTSSSDYTAKLAAAISDLAGNPLGDDFTWGFTTSAAVGVGAWSQTSTSNAPFERRGHSALWSGSEFIVFGGYGWLQSIGQFVETDTGGRYNPQSDNWQATNTEGVTAFNEHTAILANGEMIVWGGRSNNGARYDLGTDSWQPVTNLGAPSARRRHLAVWTGSEMLIWGGENNSGQPLNTGGRYNPASDSWIAITTDNAPSPRYNMAFAWSGSELIVWGGSQGPGTTLLIDGARYNPATDTWQPLPAVAVAGSGELAAVWSGTEMILFNGGQAASLDSNGFPINQPSLRLYNPITNQWRASTNGCEPYLGAGVLHTAWTGTEMFVWGDNSRGGYFYDPISDEWRAVASLGGPAARREAAATWADNRFILWGGQEPGGLQDTGFIFSE
ncbi:Ig-like domain-containing protein [Halioxenophilus sp. WMMB6]|uniref:Ig-like domain-containing protein n=1 Tax=Halioxenophilus sp. WMMB6 TaxID=3073815 RepID=UPI00295E74B9|nr:Ig-like domain-containing protein [Halioxenophilus sp. WMMB6]